MITLINPHLVTQLGDFLGSGIPYMPVTLAYLASALSPRHEVQVIDCFGENPTQIWYAHNQMVQGLTYKEVTAKIAPDTETVIVYFSTIQASAVVFDLVSRIKVAFADIPVIIIENSQAVIGCSLEYMLEDLFGAGADYVILGECEERTSQLLDFILRENRNALPTIDGVCYQHNGTVIKVDKKQPIEDLDQLPFPRWDLFPLQNYWDIGYAHGPLEGNKYLALMTSRGCPFQCNFCVIPSTNDRKWRARSPKNVVEEIEYLSSRFGVSEFHWEDVNPTASEKRIVAICNLIIEKNLHVKWKLASGSKIETLGLSTLELMKKAGCNYISFSPETGSPRVLKLMNKPFNHRHALAMVRKMNELGISSQACFVLGYPGEEKDDLQITRQYVRQLVRAGADEIALFIMTPIPGTKTFGQVSGFKDLSELTFSPTWRDDYKDLARFRTKVYFEFLLWKTVFHPRKVLAQGINFLTRSFKSKAEMNVYRLLSTRYGRRYKECNG